MAADLAVEVEVAPPVEPPAPPKAPNPVVVAEAASPVAAEPVEVAEEIVELFTRVGSWAPQGRAVLLFTLVLYTIVVLGLVASVHTGSWKNRHCWPGHMR
jgi:hypothetical protein